MGCAALAAAVYRVRFVPLESFVAEKRGNLSGSVELSGTSTPCSGDMNMPGG
jgi:hypothetical protein